MSEFYGEWSGDELVVEEKKSANKIKLTKTNKQTNTVNK